MPQLKERDRNTESSLTDHREYHQIGDSYAPLSVQRLWKTRMVNKLIVACAMAPTGRLQRENLKKEQCSNDVRSEIA